MSSKHGFNEPYTRLDTSKSGVKQVARHLLRHALECGTLDDHTEDGADWSWTSWSIDRVELSEESGKAEVKAHQNTTVTGRQIGGGRGHGASHPPEYKRHDATIVAVAHCDFGDDPLMGNCHVHVEQDGGTPPEPDPEPEPEQREP